MIPRLPLRAISPLLFLVLGALVCLPACSGCGPNAVCNTGGINDPSNRTMRRDLLQYGLGEFCKQLTSRNAPLKLTDDAPVIGRFYPQHCTQTQLESGDLKVQFDGYGYAWNNLSKRITFTSSAEVQYNPDFRCSEDNEIYAYFQKRSMSPPDFRMNKIEAPVANLLGSVITPTVNNFGQQLLAGKLGQGFTVIRDSDGGTDFDIGLLPLGQRPFHPFKVHGSGKITYENLRTEIHTNQRDFIGPIPVEEDGRALYLTLAMDGVPAVDVFLMAKDEAEASLRQYLDSTTAGPLAFPPRFADVVQQGASYQRTLPVARGMHYVVLDNTSTAGTASPPGNQFDDRAAVVNYVIQIGDAP